MDVGLARDLLTAVLGLATGVLSGLFGVGGGVISQPGMRLLGLDPLLVIGTALPVIIPGAASGAVRFVREQLIRWPAVIATVPTGLVAAVLGSIASEHVPGEGHLLQLVTAGLLGLSAYRMGRMAPALPPDEPLAETDAPEAPEAPSTVDPARSDPAPPSQSTYVAIGAVSGLLSGLLGIGGGLIMVPAFVQLARIEVKSAIATSLVCVGAFALPGTVTHALQGHVDWRVALALVLGVVPGARLGAALTIRATDRRLRIGVASFLGCTAVLYAAGELGALLG
ncbi:MAG: sulfite exporter TauE/SafE family protein [Microthrixaceae bacterium]